jgi:hypothetical protein
MKISNIISKSLNFLLNKISKIFKKISKIFKKIFIIFKLVFKFLMKWNELITIPLGLIMWKYSGSLLRWLDPTSVEYDAGIFQIILFTIISFFIYTGVVWIYLKITFPKVYKYIDDVLGDNLEEKDLTTYQKSKIVLWLFSLLLITMVILSRIL